MGRKKEPLQLRVAGQVGIYVCGVTVYDYCHIGHARVMVVFDTIVRYLRACGLKVTYVRNFTDIDDKIIQRANALHIPFQQLTETFIEAFQVDMQALGVARADREPKATDHLAEMQQMIDNLIRKGLAYPGGGDIFYAVDRFQSYGQLSGKNLAELQSGSRVDVDTHKQNPLDFVLWKKAKPDEPHWPSPWGEGRPGWHIECSAMSCKYLGESFDIHGGGMDLLFPHHENEIAQTEGSSGQPWVRYWLHNGFVNVLTDSGEREKMSKSLGNFFTIRDLLAHYPGEVLRLFILNSHYRSPLDFSSELLDAARHGMDRLYSALAGAKKRLQELPVAATGPLDDTDWGHWAEEMERFLVAMDDDFNTPQAIAVLFEMAKQINRLVATETASVQEISQGVQLLRQLAALLGLLTTDPDHYFHQLTSTGLGDADIDALIQQRLAARLARNFQEADRIRQQLLEAGIVLQDAKEGTTWRRS
ncbi:MAG: cysteine--tRNA ligase [Magnetococcales bacterium]|nr:cysteine--tRNA ligase [Magnetococcales bacterium]